MKQLEEPITERRRKTRNSIYRYLHQCSQPRSQQEIAQSMALSLPTVHQNLIQLLDAGLVRYGGVQRSTGGRRAMSLTIDENARFAVGVAITENRFRFLAANLRLEQLAYKKTGHLAVEKPSELGAQVSRELELFLDESHLDRHRLLGVGVALAGVITPDRSSVMFSPTMNLRDLQIRSIQDAMPYPCFVENDGNCGGNAEVFFRAETNSVAYLSLENGVGGAVILGGKNYLGSNSRSGEFGHLCVHPGGRKCQCGKQGCLEAYCSARRIGEDLGVSMESFFSGLAEGKTEYLPVWEDFLQHLALGVYNVHTILDCDLVLGGFLAPYLEPWLPELRRRVQQLDPFNPNADYIKLSASPRRAVVQGAALHFVQEFIESV